jgi:sugar lactone lactonase YvrE
MTAPTIKLLKDTGISSSDNITSNYQLNINGSISNYLFLISSNGNALTSWLTYSQYTAWMNTNESSVENAVFQVQATLAGNIGVSGNVINSTLVGSLSFTLDETGAQEVVNSVHLSSDTGVSATDFITNVAAQTLTGTLSNNLVAGDMVMVSVNNGETWKQATATTGQNSWSLVTTLTSGSNEILAYVKDVAGVVQTTDFSQSYTLDTKAPTVTDSESIYGLKNTNSDIITVSVGATTSADPIASVAIYNGSSLVGYATANGNGAWTYNAANLADGSVNNFYAVVTDTAGNSKTTAALKTFSVASQAPTVAITESQSGLNSSTKDTLTISATADAAAATGNAIASIAIYNGSILLDTLKPNGNGSWTFTPAKLADGQQDFYAVVTDKAGNTATTTTLTDTVASKAPTVSTTQSESGLTNQNTDVITVNATADAVTGNAIQSVTIYDKDNTGFEGQATLQANGSWSYTATDLTDGNHQFYAVAKDSAGNSTTGAALAVVRVDSQPPVVSITESKTGLTNATKDLLDITATADTTATGNKIATVAVYDGSTLLGDAKLVGTNLWSFTDSSLTDGVHNFSAVVSDTAGNVSTTQTVTLTEANQAPAVTSIQSEAGVTNNTTDLITINAVADNVPGNAIQSVVIYDKSNSSFSGQASLQSDGGWTYSAGNLTDGIHEFYAVVTDNAGNQTKTSALAPVDIATSAPVISASQSLPVISTQTTDTIKVTALAESISGNAISTVKIYQAFDNGAQSFVGNATQYLPSVWSYVDSNLNAGIYTFTAVVTDKAGNSSTETLPTVTVATVFPTVSVSQSVSGLTNQSSETLTINASAEAIPGNSITSVAIYDNNVFVADAVNNNNGNYNFSAVVTDAENHTTKAGFQSLSIATQAPRDAISQSASSLTNNTSDLISGTATVENVGGNQLKSVEIYQGSQEIGQAAINAATGAWSYDVTGLSDGTYKFSAVITDQVGNQFVDNNLKAFTVQTETSWIGLSNPDTISTDNNGNVYIANSNTVEIFNASGILETTLPASSFTPEDIATDNNGDVFVAYNDYYVEEFDSSGNLIQVLTDGINNPTAVATDSNGDVYVVNANNVEEFDPSGNLLQTLTTGLTSPDAIAIAANGNVFILDAGNASTSPALLEYDSSGNLLNNISLSGGPGNPASLVIDNSGNAFIGYYGYNPVVQEYNATGSLVNTLHTQSGSNTQNFAASPNSMATDNNGDLYVANQSNNTVTEFNAAGVIVRTFTFNPAVQNDALSLAFNNSNNSLYVADYANNTVSSISAAYTIAQTSAAISNVTTDTLSGYANPEANTSLPISNVEIYNGGTDLGAATLDSATGAWYFTAANLANGSYQFSAVITDQAGNQYVDNSLSAISVATQAPQDSIAQTAVAQSAISTDYLTGTATADNLPGNNISNVEIFDGSTDLGRAILTQTGNPNVVDWSYTAQNLAAGVHDLSAVITDAVGNQYTDTNLAAFSIVSDTLVMSFTTDLNQPQNIVLDNFGDIYVANSGNNTIEEFDSSGNLLQTISNGVNQPGAMVTDSNGDIYVVNSGNNTVEEFDPSGNLLQTIATGQTPVSLAITSNGDIFVANQSGNAGSIQEFDPAGNLLNTISTGLQSLSAMVADNNGDVYVADAGNVLEFNASGSLINTIAVADQTSLLYSNGDLYAIGANNVEEINSAGDVVNTFAVAGTTELAADQNGNVYVLNASNNISEFNAAGALIQTIQNQDYSPFTGITTDSQGNVYVTTSNNTVEEYAAFNALTATANASIADPTVVYNPNPGNQITFANATSFNATAITADNVTAAGGNTANLADWVAGALSGAGADIAQNQIAWFNFSGSTYLVEQANSQGTAYGAGDTLVQLVGTLNESSASLTAHTLTL